MDLENSELIDNSHRENEQSEDELIKIRKSHPILRELAQAVSEEFDENGNYIYK